MCGPSLARSAGRGDGLFLDAYTLDDVDDHQGFSLSVECFECGVLVECKEPIASVTTETTFEVL